MDKTVGVRFRTAGKVYYFDSAGFVLNRGDKVILEPENGFSIGTVAIPPFENSGLVYKETNGQPLKKVYRIANKNDFIRIEQNKEIEKQAYDFGQECISRLSLKMNLFAVESSLNNEKLVFFFTSDGRVDFRELVKEIVKKFSTRVELRQVGVRHQTKMCGGIGRCGRELCCATFLEKFGSVSIRMAKDQGLSLNPSKISGLCGRLMCCLTFEDETYRNIIEKLPKIGKMIHHKGEDCKVSGYEVLNERVILKRPNNKEVSVDAERIFLSDSKL